MDHSAHGLTTEVHTPNTIVNLLFPLLPTGLHWLSNTEFSLFQQLSLRFCSIWAVPSNYTGDVHIGAPALKPNDGPQLFLWMRWMCVNFDLLSVCDDRHLLPHLPSSLQIALITYSSYVIRGSGRGSRLDRGKWNHYTLCLNKKSKKLSLAGRNGSRADWS